MIGSDGHYLRSLSFSVSDLRRFACLAATCLCMATAGSLFSFSVLIPAFTTHLAYSSSDINVISGVGNAALYVTFLGIGPMYDFCGARLTLLFAAVTYALGYLLMYFAYNKTIGFSVAAMSMFYFLAGTGATAAYMAAIGVNLTNFTRQANGKVTGVLLLFYGLSGTIYSQVFNNFYSSDTSSYLLFLAASVGISNIVAMLAVTKDPAEEQSAANPPPTAPSTTTDQPKHPTPARIQSQLSIATIPELYISSHAVNAAISTTHGTRSGNATPFLRSRTPTVQPPSRAEPLSASPVSASQDVFVNEVGFRTVGCSEGVGGSRATVLTDSQTRLVGDNAQGAAAASLSPLEILKSTTFWLFTATFVFQQGLTYISNVSALLAASDGVGSDSAGDGKGVAARAALHLTLISVFQSAGRLGFGLAVDLISSNASGAATTASQIPQPPRYDGEAGDEEKLEQLSWNPENRTPWHKTLVPNDATWLLLLSQVILEVPHVVLGIGGAAAGNVSESWLMLCSVLVGLGFGAAGACFPGLTREYFGMAYYGTACGFVMGSVPLGILLSNTIFGQLLDKNQQPNEPQCWGVRCFSDSFLIFSAIQLVPIGTCAALVWMRRSRKPFCEQNCYLLVASYIGL
ncbi:major facilitator superfamily domain-containing protein [Zopfochytrium polystomum]|nr:major facilitator superfamily domain-containing protein [Zopfochytrium polystomum]